MLLAPCLAKEISLASEDANEPTHALCHILWPVHVSYRDWIVGADFGVLIHELHGVRRSNQIGKSGSPAWLELSVCTDPDNSVRDASGGGIERELIGRASWMLTLRHFEHPAGSSGPVDHLIFGDAVLAFRFSGCMERKRCLYSSGVS